MGTTKRQVLSDLEDSSAARGQPGGGCPSGTPRALTNLESTRLEARLVVCSHAS